MPVAPILRRPAALICVLAALLCAGRTGAQMPKLFSSGPLDAARSRPSELVKTELLADGSAIVPGRPFTVGLRLQMAPAWHTYWQYSGDAGLPTKLAWTLPEGFKAGPIQWPLPEKTGSPGDIVNYGYGNEVMLLVDITPPATLPPGDMTLKAKADWLVCRESCIPGSKELVLTLPVGSDARPANAEIFGKYRALLPRQHDPAETFGVRWQSEGRDLLITVGVTHSAFFPVEGFKAQEQVPALEFYPLPTDPAEVGHPVVLSPGVVDGSPGLQVKVRVPMVSDLKDSNKVAGVLVADRDGKRIGWAIPSEDVVTKPGGFYLDGMPSAGNASAPVPPAATGGGTGVTPPSGTSASTAKPSGGSLPYFLLIGFLGGLILNVMPCVLPVISLKLFSFVKQANQSRERIFKLGLAYTAGVFAWFLGFAALVVALKAAGHQVGYAFHLQNPWFLVGLSAVTFVFALNLLGVFEVILPGSLTGAAGEVAGSREGYSGAFLQGMLATVLGSACTAPFFGPALGFAFSQNGPVIFAMFAAIAAGMSAPFVLLAAQPGWMKFLPRPGAWMEHVKQATGFLLLATMLWLLFSLGRGLGADAVVWTGMLMLVLGAACWVQGTFNTLVASDRVRWASRLVIAGLVFGGGWGCIERIAHSAPPPAMTTEPFAVQLDAALKTGRTVFVDLTAEWCVSCKANEKTVLDSDAVQSAFKSQNVVFLTGDFTTYSEDIAKLLKQYNAPSVPLYLVYLPGKPDAPVVLPPILTRQVVLDALAAAPTNANKPVAAR